jgi:hypothetical protein
LSLLCTQSIFAHSSDFFAITLLTNVTRLVEVPRYYTVLAIDPAQWTEAEAQLKALFDPYDVVGERRDSDTARWIIVTNGKDQKDAIETLDTVRLMDPTPQPEGREPRDNDTYIAFAKPSGDSKAIDAFITSQVQPGNPVYRLAHKDRTTAWYNIHLTAEAKQAVEKYEGVDSIRDGDEARFLSSETHRSSPPIEASPEATAVKEYEKVKFFKVGRTEGTRYWSSSQRKSSLPQRDNKRSILPRVGDCIGPI